MLINTNSKDFYPELPEQFKKPRKKLILNVWHNCKHDTEDTNNQMAVLDIETESFEIELFIKNEEDIDKVKQTIRSFYQIYKTAFLELIIKSEKYPRIDFDTIL